MYAGKKVLVLGLAKSGMAATKLLLKIGAKVTLNESKEAHDIPEYDELVALGVEMIVGGQPSELFERDFDFVVKNPGIKYTMPFIIRLQERKIPIYTEIELAFQVAKPQHYIAITGTNGKTTTASLVYEIIKKQYDNTYVAGNIGLPLCQVVLENDLFNVANCYIVLEMSNFQLLNIDQFKPEIATVINLTPDHLDYMRNLDEYYASKMNIYKNQDDSDVFLKNIDDQNIIEYTNLYPIRAKSLTFSLDKDADIMIKDNNIICCNKNIISLDSIKIVGKHNVQNVMIAIGIALKVGINNEIIKEVIENFTGVEHRVEYVTDINGVSYYNDSKATNTDATIIAIKAFEKPLLLLIGGFDKGLDMSVLSEYLLNVKKAICFGAAGKRFASELPNSVYVKNMEEAVLLAHKLATNGDVVLLSPSTSSFDEFKGYEERGRIFKKIVKDLESK